MRSGSVFLFFAALVNVALAEDGWFKGATLSNKPPGLVRSAGSGDASDNTISTVDLLLANADVRVQSCGHAWDEMQIENINLDPIQLRAVATGILRQDVWNGTVHTKMSISPGSSFKAKLTHAFASITSSGFTRAESLCDHLYRTNGFQRSGSTCPLQRGQQTLVFGVGRLPSQLLAGKYVLLTNITNAAGVPLMCFSASFTVPAGPKNEQLRILRANTADDCRRLASLRRLPPTPPCELETCEASGWETSCNWLECNDCDKCKDHPSREENRNALPPSGVYSYETMSEAPCPDECNEHGDTCSTNPTECYSCYFCAAHVACEESVHQTASNGGYQLGPALRLPSTWAICCFVLSILLP